MPTAKVAAADSVSGRFRHAGLLTLVFIAGLVRCAVLAAGLARRGNGSMCGLGRLSGLSGLGRRPWRTATFKPVRSCRAACPGLSSFCPECLSSSLGRMCSLFLGDLVAAFGCVGCVTSCSGDDRNAGVDARMRMSRCRRTNQSENEGGGRRGDGHRHTTHGDSKLTRSGAGLAQCGGADSPRQHSTHAPRVPISWDCRGVRRSRTVTRYSANT